MSREFLFTNPDTVSLDNISVSPEQVELLSKNIEDMATLGSKFINFEKFQQNLESNIGSIGIGTNYSNNAPANPFQNTFPLVNWLLNTPASRKMQTALNNGAWSVYKKTDGKYYAQLPWMYGTTLPESTKGDCCWVPLDLAKCGGDVPLALLCLKDCEKIMDNLVNNTRKFKSNDMICYFMREGETVKEARVRMAKISMAYFTAMNIILGTMATGTDTLKPFHGLQEVMEDKAVIKIVGTNVLSAFESVGSRLSVLGDGEYKFAVHPLVYEAIKSYIVPGKFNGEYPEGWDRKGDEITFKGIGFIKDKLMSVDLTKAVGDVWVLEGNTVGAFMGTTLMPGEKFQRHTFGPTDKPEDGCAAECDYYYNFGAAFGTNANKLMVISSVPLSAELLGTTFDGLDLVINPKTIVPINIGE